LVASSGIAAQENPGVETLHSTAVLPRAVIRVESTIRTWEFALSLELRWGGCCRGCTQRSMNWREGVDFDSALSHQSR
jgi:hypothetical protein